MSLVSIDLTLHIVLTLSTYCITHEVKLSAHLCHSLSAPLNDFVGQIQNRTVCRTIHCFPRTLVIPCAKVSSLPCVNRAFCWLIIGKIVNNIFNILKQQIFHEKWILTAYKIARKYTFFSSSDLQDISSSFRDSRPQRYCRDCPAILN